VKYWVVFFSLATALLPFPVAAQNRPEGRGFGQGNPARPPAPQRVPVRDPAAENRNPNHRMQMTPEQRQQLRRDIHDHGRDIYRDRGAGGRRR
jgi:hypothetical protein